MQSVFKFSDVLFALKSDGPPFVEASQVSLTVGQPLGQTDIQADIPPVEALQVSLTFGQPLGQADIQANVHPNRHLVAKTSTKLVPVDLSSDVPPIEASSDHEQYYIRSA